MAKTRSSDGFPRLGIIGCGNITEKAYLPALKKLGWKPVVFVDTDLGRAREMASRVKGAAGVDRLEDAIKAPIDAAVVATPHRAHHAIGLELLNGHVAVLMEKPLATSASQCADLIEAAKASGSVLAVGHFRRFVYTLGVVREALQAGALGKLHRFSISDGYIYDWDMKTDSLLKKSEAGGGVLMDLGSHAIDLAIWMFGKLDIAEYEDDADGGIEGDARLVLRGADGLVGEVVLSRIRKLRGTLRIEGELGAIEVALQENRVVELPETTDSPELVALRDGPLPAQPWTKLFELQLQDFAARVGGDQPVSQTIEDAATGSALIEQCYAVRQPMKMEWRTSFADGRTSDGDIPRWFITGATGFIGSRIVECLQDTGRATPICLIRTRASAVRLARRPMETTIGPVDDPDVLDQGVRGCDTIVHCAHDLRNPKANMAAVENIVRAAKKHGVRRVVHLSSVAVYEPLQGKEVTERSPRESKKYLYQNNKLDSENRILEIAAQEGVEVVVLQPTVVYGPFSRPWTIGPVETLLGGGIVLPSDGEGICNPVYVDDVAAAVLAASESSAGVGDRFLITGRDHVTWRQFYETIARIVHREDAVRVVGKDVALGGRGGRWSSLTAVASNPASLLRAAAQNPAARGVMSSVFDALPESGKRLAYRAYLHEPSGGSSEHVPTGPELELYSSEAVVNASHAREALSFSPTWSFADGMVPTRAWIEWAFSSQLPQSDLD